MSNNKTFYEILNLTAHAAMEDIKESFHTLAMQHHPDKNGNSPESEVHFRIILNAYKTLADATARSAYDSYLATSSVVKKHRKPAGGNRARRQETSFDYFCTQLNYVLWEVEDIVVATRVKEERTVSGKTIKQWLLEILLFIDRWVLEPCGFKDYFYAARKIDKVELYGSIGENNKDEAHKPFASFEDYFYEIRKRMNRFMESGNAHNLVNTIEGTTVTVADSILETLMLSYHYLRCINGVLLNDDMQEIVRFTHSSGVYEPEQKLLPKK